MRHIRRFSIVLLAAGMVCSSFFVGTGVLAAGEKPCAEDMEKFCKGIPMGPGLMECLEKHEKQLSRACRDHEATMLGRTAEKREKARDMARFRQVCNNDMARFCKDVDPAQGGLMKCLKAHEKELSGPCSASMKEISRD